MPQSRRRSAQKTPAGCVAEQVLRRCHCRCLESCCRCRWLSHRCCSLLQAPPPRAAASAAAASPLPGGRPAEVARGSSALGPLWQAAAGPTLMHWQQSSLSFPQQLISHHPTQAACPNSALCPPNPPRSPPADLQRGAVLAAPKVVGHRLVWGIHVPPAAPHAAQLQQLLSKEQARQVAGVGHLRGRVKEQRVAAGSMRQAAASAPAAPPAQAVSTNDDATTSSISSGQPPR